jgi:hypothetical protein
VHTRPAVHVALDFLVRRHGQWSSSHGATVAVRRRVPVPSASGRRPLALAGMSMRQNGRPARRPCNFTERRGPGPAGGAGRCAARASDSESGGCECLRVPSRLPRGPCPQRALGPAAPFVPVTAPRERPGAARGCVLGSALETPGFHEYSLKRGMAQRLRSSCWHGFDHRSESRKTIATSRL